MISKFPSKPEEMYLNHGEPHAAQILRVKLQDERQVPTHRATDGEIVEPTDQAR